VTNAVARHLGVVARHLGEDKFSSSVDKSYKINIEISAHHHTSMIICLCGAQGSGKDTVANILVVKHGYVKISFASALKDVVSILFSWPRHMLEGDTPESRLWREAPNLDWSQKTGIADFSPRKALQYVGTDLIRNQVYANIWTNIVENRILMILEANREAKIVINDCRFLNEIEMLKKFSSTGVGIIRIMRPDCETAVGQTHSSETEYLDHKIDITLINNSTREALEKSLEWVLNNGFL